MATKTTTKTVKKVTGESKKTAAMKADAKVKMAAVATGAAAWADKQAAASVAVKAKPMAAESFNGGLVKAVSVPAPILATLEERAKGGALIRFNRNDDLCTKMQAIAAASSDGDVIRVTYGDGAIAGFKADAINLTPSVVNQAFLGWEVPGAAPLTFEQRSVAAQAETAAKHAAAGGDAPTSDTIGAVMAKKTKSPKKAKTDKPAKAEKPRLVKSEPRADGTPCTKCGRVNPGGKDCQVPNACKRRAEARVA